MISFAILTLFTIPGLCTQLRLVRSASNIFVAESPPVIEQFSWDAIVDRTGVNPSDYLPTPAAGAPETFACTTDPGPDRLVCPHAIDVWTTLVDENNHVNLTAGQCQSVTQDCCQTIVCAISTNLSIPPAEVVGRMWNPLTMKCVLNGKGGVWQSEGSTFFVQMERPDDCQYTI